MGGEEEENQRVEDEVVWSTSDPEDDNHASHLGEAANTTGTVAAPDQGHGNDGEGDEIAAARHRERDPSMDPVGTPHRRSYYELQRDVDDLFAKYAAGCRESRSADSSFSSPSSQGPDSPSRQIALRDVPSVLADFERAREIIILEPSGKAELDFFAKSNPDLVVEPQTLLQLIIGMTGGHAISPSGSGNGSEMTTGGFAVYADNGVGRGFGVSFTPSSPSPSPAGDFSGDNTLEPPPPSPTLGGGLVAAVDDPFDGSSPTIRASTGSSPGSSAGEGPSATEGRPSSSGSSDDGVQEGELGVDAAGVSPFSFNPPSGVSTPGGGESRDMDSPFRSSHDELSILRRKVEELQRRLRESERLLEAEREDSEMASEEAWNRFEEVKAELVTRRKEDKELKVKERALNTHIDKLEADISGLEKSLEVQKQSYSSMKKAYEDQCAESEKLRNQVRSKAEDLRLAEESARRALVDAERWEQEREILESAISKLEADLFRAGEAEDALEEAKRETMTLSETIDRLKFELDERRRPASFIDSSSAGSSLPGSITRTLGRELQAQLGGGHVEGEERLSGLEDEGEETIITKRKIGGRRRPGSLAQGTEAQVKYLTDAWTQYEASQFQVTASVQTEEAVPPAPTPPPVQKSRKEMADAATGADSLPPAPVLTGRAAIPIIPLWQQPNRLFRAGHASRIINYFPRSTQSWLHSVLFDSQASTLVLYSLCIFLGGFISGGALMPGRGTTSVHNHYGWAGEDRAAWYVSNTLGVGGIREGFMDAAGGGFMDAAGGGFEGWAMGTLERIIWRGVSIAQRNPT